MKSNRVSERDEAACIDNIFTIKQIIEKRREQHLETHLLFVDYSKAFGKVPRSILWRFLEKKRHSITFNTSDQEHVCRDQDTNKAKEPHQNK